MKGALKCGCTLVPLYETFWLSLVSHYIDLESIVKVRHFTNLFRKSAEAQYWDTRIIRLRCNNNQRISTSQDILVLIKQLLKVHCMKVNWLGFPQLVTDPCIVLVQFALILLFFAVIQVMISNSSVSTLLTNVVWFSKILFDLDLISPTDFNCVNFLLQFNLNRPSIDAL